MNNNNLNLNENNERKDNHFCNTEENKDNKTECLKSDIDTILTDRRNDDIFYLKSIGYKLDEIAEYFNLSTRQCIRICSSKCHKSYMTIEEAIRQHHEDNIKLANEISEIALEKVVNQIKELQMECDSLKAIQAEFESIVADKIKANILECDLDKYVLFNNRTKEELVLTDVEIAKYLNKNEQAICDLIKRRLVDKNEPELFLGNGFTVKLPKIRKINKYDFKDNEDKNTEDEDVEN